MKLCIYGAGAIGSHVAVRLGAARAAEVSVVARGVQLKAIRERGLTLRRGGQETTVMPAAATDDPATLPPQDLVVVTLKAYAVPGEAARLARLLAPEAAALFVLNGIPWWWNYGLTGSGGPLPLLDPGGALWAGLGPERAIGCVVYSSNTVTAPGVVTHDGGNRWLIGEPDGSDSARTRQTVALFQKAGLHAEASHDLRRAVWRKLVMNVAFNPLCALARRATSGIARDPALAATARSLVEETLAVAAALGWDIRDEIDAASLLPTSGGDWRPSMLQDVERGRPIEVEAILGQVHEFARGAGIKTPAIESVLPQLRALDRSLRGTA
jgi:2-dehydropantoate 2-reductase